MPLSYRWGCPVPVRESDSVRSVPSAFATIKGLKGLKGPKGILADDFEDSSDYAFAAHSDDFDDSKDFASRGSVRCPVPVRESDSVRSVPLI